MLSWVICRPICKLCGNLSSTDNLNPLNSNSAKKTAFDRGVKYVSARACVLWIRECVCVRAYVRTCNCMPEKANLNRVLELTETSKSQSEPFVIAQLLTLLRCLATLALTTGERLTPTKEYSSTDALGLTSTCSESTTQGMRASTKCTSPSSTRYLIACRVTDYIGLITAWNRLYRTCST